MTQQELPPDHHRGPDPSGQPPAPAAEAKAAGPVPLWRMATTEVAGLVVDVEIDSQLGRPIGKDRALIALAARREIAARMRRYEPSAIRTARAAGASWPEIDRARNRNAGESQGTDDPALGPHRTFDPPAPEHHNSSPPAGPEL